VFKREPSVERGIELIAKFSTSLQISSVQCAGDQATEVEDTASQDDMHPFLLQLFKFLLKVKSHQMKSNTNQMVYFVLRHKCLMRNTRKISEYI